VLPSFSSGTNGQFLVRTNDGASWQTVVALPEGGTVGQALIKSGTADGEATWSSNFKSAGLLTPRTISLTGVVTGSISFDGTSDVNIATTVNSGNTILIFANKVLSTSGWSDDETYEDYPYVQTVSCDNVTADYFPEVVFGLEDATSGLFTPICESVSGGIKIWAADIPESDITIPSIKCTKAMS